MPFTSGSVKTLNQVFSAMTTFAAANGWTILDGAQHNGAVNTFPLNYRYYRLVLRNPLSGSILQISKLKLRATAGGSNLTLTPAMLTFTPDDLLTDLPANLLDDSFLTQVDLEPDDAGPINVTFGANQLLRQIVIGVTTATYGPTSVEVYASHDGTANSWMLAHIFTGLVWSANEEKLLTLPADGNYFASSTPTGGPRFPCEYRLRGPGYDAARRVYVNFRLWLDLTSGNSGCYMNGATDYNALIPEMHLQQQALIVTKEPVFVVEAESDDMDYWVYVNSLRIILVVRSATGDYASMYAGFVSAFANPDQHPSPLYLAGTSPNTFYNWDVANASNSSFFDPGTAGGQILEWDGLWNDVSNNQVVSLAGHQPASEPLYWVYPWHLGLALSSSASAPLGFPMSGWSNQANGFHWLKNFVATLQDELPVLDAIIYGREYGAVGKLQGVVAIPGSASLVPEQVLVIGGQNYRVFPKRVIREDSQWFAVQEL
jgi:hypothetical protein